MYVAPWIHHSLFCSCNITDNEFTQLMKGFQGERLRQAFRYLDVDQDGYIRPEEFKRIILVILSCFMSHASLLANLS